MKSAADSSNGATETIIRKRNLSPAELISEGKTPDCWEYLRDVKDWAKHVVYVHRVEPAPSVPIFKCYDSHFKLPNGRTVAISDEQEMDFALLENWGGGTYRFMVKNGPQLVTRAIIQINAPVRAITLPDEGQNGSNPAGNGTGNARYGSDSAMIAGKAIDTIAGADHQAVRIGIDALAAAAQTIKNFGGGGNSELTQQIIAVLVATLPTILQRLMAPAPQTDPLELLTKVLALQAQLNPQRSADESWLKIQTAAIDRLLTPPVATGHSASLGTELLRSAPSLIQNFAEVMKEQRMGLDAQARVIAVQRGLLPAAPAQPQPNPSPAPPANGAQPANGQPSMEFVEAKIVEILQSPNHSADQAADEVMSFLQTLDAQAVNQLAVLGETGLLSMFQQRPILSKATHNMPRLVEFIRAFLRMHAEDQVAAGEEPLKAPLPN